MFLSSLHFTGPKEKSDSPNSSIFSHLVRKGLSRFQRKGGAGMEERKGKLKKLRNHCSNPRSLTLTQLLGEFNAAPSSTTDLGW